MTRFLSDDLQELLVGATLFRLGDIVRYTAPRNTNRKRTGKILRITSGGMALVSDTSLPNVSGWYVPLEECEKI